MNKGIFITGTGTDIGKTFVTALLLKKIRDKGKNACYYKAALSGATEIDNNLIAGDAKYVCDISGLKENPNNLVTYIYKNAVSPHLAANINNNQINLNKIKKHYNDLYKTYDFVVVEGSGGIICPLKFYDGELILLEDIIKLLNLDSIIVADAGLGTINATVLTVEYMKSKYIKIKGIIVNNYEPNNVMHNDNIEMIYKLTNIPIISKVKKDDINIDIDMTSIM